MYGAVPHGDTRLTPVQHAFGIVTGAVAGSTLVAPLTTIKTILQVGEHARPISAAGIAAAAARAAAVGGGAAESIAAAARATAELAPRSASAEVRSLIASGGVRALWRGHTATLARLVPLVGVQALAFSMFAARTRDPVSDYVDDVDLMVAGAGAALVARLLSHPLDMLRTRMIVDPLRHPSLIEAKNSVRLEGARALFNGITTLLVDTWPYAVVGGLSYAAAWKIMDVPNEPQRHVGHTIAAASFATFMSQTVMYPVETMRKRLQAQEIKPMPDLAVDPMEDPKEVAARKAKEEAAKKARAAAAANAAKADASASAAAAAGDAAAAEEAGVIQKAVHGAAIELEGVFAGMRQIGARAILRGIFVSSLRVIPAASASALTYELVRSLAVYTNGYTESPWSDIPAEDVDQTKPAGRAIYHRAQ